MPVSSQAKNRPDVEPAWRFLHEKHVGIMWNLQLKGQKKPPIDRLWTYGDQFRVVVVVRRPIVLPANMGPAGRRSICHKSPYPSRY